MLVWRVCEQEQGHQKWEIVAEEKQSSLFTNLTVGHLDSLGTVEPNAFSEIHLIHKNTQMMVPVYKRA